MNIIVLGPQGSGKGTQAELLSERLGYFHMESGKLLRELAKTNKILYETIYVRGELVPDQETIDYIEKHLDIYNPSYEKIIFDGFPRALSQFQLLMKWLNTKGKTIEKVFYIYISQEETIKRLSARRTCEECGTVYNLITNPPSEVNTCACGGKLVQREDDKPEVIERRLRIFHERTEPMIEEIRKLGILIEIDGEAPIEDIYKSIIRNLS
jgi:adenylate kinase